jgi:hypothetical protein
LIYPFIHLFNDTFSDPASTAELDKQYHQHRGQALRGYLPCASNKELAARAIRHAGRNRAQQILITSVKPEIARRLAHLATRPEGGGQQVSPEVGYGRDVKAWRDLAEQSVSFRVKPVARKP